MNSVSTLPSPTSSRVSYRKSTHFLPLLSCPNHAYVIPDFIPSHALHFQSISSPPAPTYKILLLSPLLSSRRNSSKRSHLTTAMSAPSLRLALFHVFQNKGADCDDVTTLRTLCLALTRFLTQSISCSVVQGLAFLSNFKLYHISPKCSSYFPSFLQLKTHHKFLQPKDLLPECNPPLFTQSLFAQLTSTGRQVSAQLSSPHGHLC